MATLKEEAITYVSNETKNIADLDKVDISLVVNDDEAVDSDGEKFFYKYVKLNDEQYRVPKSVLKNLKVLLLDNPNLKEFKVIKTGKGMDTTYTVVPLS